jgi:hypothetical protein
MITKERLEELIEQEATIYFIYNNNVDEKEGVYKDDFILSETYVSIYWNTRSHQIKYEYLFETKEDAEWYREFGCIERTERLELPTWEESKECDTICCFGDVAFDYFVHDNTYGLYQDCRKLLDLEATKENYTLACRKCVELFLGEKK